VLKTSAPHKGIFKTLRKQWLFPSKEPFEAPVGRETAHWPIRVPKDYKDKEEE
jgi:hypothetical protein